MSHCEGCAALEREVASLAQRAEQAEREAVPAITVLATIAAEARAAALEEAFAAQPDPKARWHCYASGVDWYVNDPDYRTTGGPICLGRVGRDAAWAVCNGLNWATSRALVPGDAPARDARGEE